MTDRLIALQTDITKLEVDAIVNAANQSLRGGGGVDGAIHHAAGRELLAACIEIGNCPRGEAVITPGFALPAKYVIHTVGPAWRGGDRNEPQLLAECYRNSLSLAVENAIRTIAFPAISCGIFCYPVDQAVAIAVREVQAFLERDETIEQVIFACFEKEVFAAYRKELGKGDAR